MSAKRLDGRQESERLLKKLGHQIGVSRRRVTLATVLIGARYDSALYIRLKRQAASRVGIDTEYHHLPTRTTQARLEKLIRSLNRRRTIDGILLQLPLPAHLDADAAVAAIDPRKDVDGFQPQNTKVLPPPVAAVLRLIAMGKPRPGSLAMIVAQPSVFTVRLAAELERRKYDVCVVESHRRLRPVVSKADILVTVLGRGPQLSGGDIKRGAVVVDVGIRKHGRRTVGDIAPSAWPRAKAISPVPGGVGPLTVAYVLLNTFTLARKHGRPATTRG